MKNSMIKIYKNKIVVFTPNYKTTLKYSFIDHRDGEKDHRWDSGPLGGSFTANANYYSREVAKKEVLKWIKLTIKQRHCDHVEGESCYTSWTECVKCKKLMSYKNQKL
jgi:hypothetical protein